MTTQEVVPVRMCEYMHVYVWAWVSFVVGLTTALLCPLIRSLAIKQKYTETRSLSR